MIQLGNSHIHSQTSPSDASTPLVHPIIMRKWSAVESKYVRRGPVTLTTFGTNSTTGLMAVGRDCYCIMNTFHICLAAHMNE